MLLTNYYKVYKVALLGFKALNDLAAEYASSIYSLDIIKLCFSITFANSGLSLSQRGVVPLQLVHQDFGCTKQPSINCGGH